MTSNQADVDMDGVQQVTTTIEKVALENGRELQWLIRNFDVIHSSSLQKMSQMFGPLNGKLTIKLELTKINDSLYELSAEIRPHENLMWVNLQFRMHGDKNVDFALNGNPNQSTGQRLTYQLNIPVQETLKFTFKPEILLSVSNVDVGPQNVQFTAPNPNSEPPNDQSQNTQNNTFPNQWANGLPSFLQHIMNQRVSECQHWMQFFREYPSDFLQMQQNLMSIFTNSELVKESPRMAQNLLNELRNNPDLANVNQRIQDVMAGVQSQCEQLRQQTRQNQQNTESTAQPTQNNQQQANESSGQSNSETTAPQPNSETTAPPQPNQAFAGFPPLMESAQQLLSQISTQENLQSISGAVQNVLESVRNNPAAQAYISQYESQFGNLSQRLEQAVEDYAQNQRNLQEAISRSFQTEPQQTAEQQDTEPQQSVEAEQVINQSEPQQSEPQVIIQPEPQQVLHSEPQSETVIIDIPEPTQQSDSTVNAVPEQIIDVEDHEIMEIPRPSAPVEEDFLELAQETPSVSYPRLSTSNEADWTFLFTAKGINGYVRHIKSLGSRVPYHRNFCPAESWKLPDGHEMKVELVHALHPDAPFICLFDYDHTSEMAFVQTLLDGNGQEVHKIDSFSNSYHGFTCDQLLKSAEIDDIVRIKLEAIPHMD